METHKDTPLTPKYLEAFQNFIEKRKENKTPMSPKPVETFQNNVETRSTSSRRKENEVALKEEKISYCKRKLDFKQNEIKHSTFAKSKIQPETQSKDIKTASHSNQINSESKTEEKIKKSNLGSSNKRSKCVDNKNNLPEIPKNEKRKTSDKKTAPKILKCNDKQINKENLTATLKNKQRKDDFGSESESEEEVKDQKKLMTELRKLFKENLVPLKPRAPTRGDGNCFFRSTADQILLHGIPDKPSTHLGLRLAVCNHIKKLPPAILHNTVNVIFKGKRRGLTGLASRQRKPGQFVDDNGIMVMATALFLGRNIHVYSENARNEFTKIDGGEGADQLEPLTIFYFREYQHYQSVAPVSKR